jgi:porin
MPNAKNIATQSKQLFVATLLICITIQGLMAQEENKLSEAFDFETTIVGDFVTNFSGGIKKGNTFIGIESLALSFDTEKGRLWKNGNFFVHGLITHGDGPSSALTGDLQVLSNIEAGNYYGLYEYYYGHQIGNFSMLFGQHDMNSEFAGTKYGGTFINSSFGIMPNISLNVPVSIYPVAAPCLMLKYNHTQFSCKLAVYDGDPGNFENNRYNLQWSISPGQGFLIIGEFQLNRVRKEKITGTYKFGTYHHSGTFTNYSDTLQSQEGNYGFYLIVDQALFATSLSAARGLCIFFQSGITPSEFNQIHYHIGGGFRYHGILPYRYYDELGIAFAHISQSKNYVNLNATALNYETAIEMTYKFQFGPYYSVQPSMQYIINPGATAGISNCLVGLFRLTLQI